MMRNTGTQYASIMIGVADMQQPMRSACLTCTNQDGQRCALLTTKSRKTCTRATVFNSSG